jgi:hypothetical protein
MTRGLDYSFIVDVLNGLEGNNEVLVVRVSRAALITNCCGNALAMHSVVPLETGRLFFVDSDSSQEVRRSKR